MQYKFFAVLASIMLILGQGGARANGLESNGDEFIIDHDSQPLSSEPTTSQDTNNNTTPDGVYLEGSNQPLAPTDNAKEDGHSVEIHNQNNEQWKEEFDHSTHSAIIDLPEAEIADKNQSKKAISFLGYDNTSFTVIIENSTINIEETKKHDINACWYIDCEDENNMIIEIDGQKALFTQVWFTPLLSNTFVYFEKNNSFRPSFPQKCDILKCQKFVGTTITYHLPPTQKPSWISDNETITWYNKVNNNNGTHIGYALYTDKNNVIYASLVNDNELQTFYYDPQTSFKVAMKNEEVDLDTTKHIPNLETCLYYLDCEEGKAEILYINGEKVLFSQPKQGATTVYFTKPDSKLQKVFPRNPKELQTSDFTYDSQNMVKPTWVSDEDRKDIAGHAELKEWEKLIGYGIRTKNGKWFYAPAAHRVNFEMNGANAIVDQIVPLDGKATKPSNPTRPGYNFGGWFADKDFKTAFDFTTTITAHTTIYAKWNRVSSGGGGSSGGSSYSAPVSSSTTGTITHSGTVDKPLLTDHCALHDPSYTDEENKAYQFACKHRITTMETIKKARIHDQVTRAEFAKMISNYAQNILGKKPNTDLQCTFADQNQVNTELSNFITTSCQLGLMGIKMEQNRFLPNKTLSRAEVATVISRLYSFAEDSTPYYKDHLKAMNTKGFITKPMPHMTEVRGYIFIMLERIATTLK